LSKAASHREKPADCAVWGVPVVDLEGDDLVDEFA